MVVVGHVVLHDILEFLCNFFSPKRRELASIHMHDGYRSLPRARQTDTDIGMLALTRPCLLYTSPSPRDS